MLPTIVAVLVRWLFGRDMALAFFGGVVVESVAAFCGRALASRASSGKGDA